jgi:ABC-type transport system involved in Fe-S cluster assembly, ATPase component
MLHKNEIFIIRKPLLHRRDEPILQKCDVLTFLQCPLDKVQATRTLPWYNKSYHYRSRMFYCSKSCTPVPNFHLYVVSQTPLCPSDTGMLIRQKSIPQKVQDFCLNEKLRNPFSIMLYSTHYLRLLTFFQSSKVHVLCCFAHRSIFSFIAVVNRGFLDSIWQLRSCLYNLRCTVLLDTTESWVFSSFVICSMLMFLFCLQIFTIFCQHAVRSCFSHHIFL